MKDWNNNKPNWYSFKFKVESTEKWHELMCWIQSNIEGYKKHTVWYFNDGEFEIRFRHVKHYEWFVLRWS